MIGPERFEWSHYVPALRLKDGEIQALLAAETKGVASYTPLFVLHAEYYEHEKRFRPATPGELTKLLQAAAFRAEEWARDPRISRLEPSRPRFFVDTARLDDINGVDALGEMLGYLATRAPSAVPVTHVERLHQHKAVRDYAAAYRTGAALRISVDGPFSIVEIDRTLRRCGLRGVEVDVIVDVGYVDPDRYDELRDRVLEYLSALRRRSWRTMTLLSGGMPSQLRGPAGETYGDWYTPRTDWRLWRDIAERVARDGEQIPAFGDYATLHAVQAAPTKMSALPPPVLRHTGPNTWWIGKRALDVDKTYKSLWENLCEKCVDTPNYKDCTRNFSHGDDWIYRAAQRNLIKARQMKQWIRSTVDHHIVFASKQIGSLTEPN